MLIFQLEIKPTLKQKQNTWKFLKKSKMSFEIWICTLRRAITYNIGNSKLSSKKKAFHPEIILQNVIDFKRTLSRLLGHFCVLSKELLYCETLSQSNTDILFSIYPPLVREEKGGKKNQIVLQFFQKHTITPVP